MTIRNCTKNSSVIGQVPYTGYFSITQIHVFITFTHNYMYISYTRIMYENKKGLNNFY